MTETPTTGTPTGTITFQVTFDAVDPHGTARFWAAALGYDVEDNSARVDQLVAAGYVQAADTVQVDGHSAFRDLEACRDPGGTQARLLFQRVPEAKAVKNRVHLDLRVGAERVEDELARLVAAGARELHRGRQGPHTWVTVADPEGNEFCLT